MLMARSALRYGYGPSLGDAAQVVNENAGIEKDGTPYHSSRIRSW